MKLRELKKQPDLIEISQKTNMKFALVNAVNQHTIKQMTPWIKCKDFFNECLVGEALGKKYSIYNFVYDPKVSFDKNRLRLAVKHDDFLLPAVTLINDLERRVKLRRSKLMQLSRDVYMVETSKWWRAAPQLISLYTFLLRLNPVVKEHNITRWEELFTAELPKDHPDANYIRRYKEYEGDKIILNLLKYRSKLFHKEHYKDYTDQSVARIHADTGIYSTIHNLSSYKHTNDIHSVSPALRPFVERYKEVVGVL